MHYLSVSFCPKLNASQVGVAFKIIVKIIVKIKDETILYPIKIYLNLIFFLKLNLTFFFL